MENAMNGTQRRRKLLDMMRLALRKTRRDAI